ncbi:MAG: hypothetical protein ACTSYF_13295, partial [Promethearchaeota archaeon]
MKAKKMTIIGIFLLSFVITSLINPFMYQSQFQAISNTSIPESNEDPLGSLAKNLTHTSDSGIISDDGNNLFTIVDENISETISFNAPDRVIDNLKYFDLDINTSFWNITTTNLTFSDFDAKNTTFVIEDYPDKVLDNSHPVASHRLAAMSFKIATICRLKNISLFVQDANPTKSWNITVFNATRGLETNFLVAPSRSTGISIVKNISTSPQAHWESFDFNDEILNMTNTYVDNDGFAYYFVIISYPIATFLDFRFLYYSDDEVPVDDGYAYEGLAFSGGYRTFEYLEGDICTKMGLAPNNTNPTAAEVGLSLKNPQPLIFENITQLGSHSQAILDVWNSSESFHYMASQNFTMADVGKVQNISLYLNQTGNFTDPIALIIVKSNSTNTGPDLGNDSSEFSSNILTASNPWVVEPGTSFQGWYNFSFSDSPYLEKDTMYWWLLSASNNVSGNVTVYGEVADTSLYSLNVTLLHTDSDWNYTGTKMNYNFSCKLGIRYGYEYYDLSDSWYNGSLYTPDLEGKYTFILKSKWYGELFFNTTYFCRIENQSMLASTTFHGTSTSSIISWNITCNVELPLISADDLNILNISIPNWNITSVYNGSSSVNYTNWRILTVNKKRFLIINNITTNIWTITGNSTNVESFLTIEKQTNTVFSIAENATIYDTIRINMSLPNQNNGTAYLSGLFPYPNNFTTFSLENNSISSNTSFYWHPSDNPLSIGGTYNFLAYWTNGTESSICTIDFLLLPNPTN